MKSLLAAFILFIPTYAIAQDSEDTPATPPAAQAQCIPLKALKARINEIPGASLKALTSNQYAFAQGVYVATPPVSSDLPPGDGAILLVQRNAAGTDADSSYILGFVNKDIVCGMIPIGPGMYGMITHAGAKK